MRLVFMGTPDFAVPSLEALLEQGHEVALVVTQPDRQAGRGRHVAASPVKQLAQRRGLAVAQPRNFREANVLELLVQGRPDVIVVSAFGQLLPPAVLGLPPHGCLNVHASLLPRHRGAAPIAAAILAGDPNSGITIMLMERGLDTGPILAQSTESIYPADTAGSLSERLARLGAALLVETLPRWASGEIRPQPQDSESATYAPQLIKQDGLLAWDESALDLWRRCRACSPWPGAFTYWEGRGLKVLAAAPLSARNPGLTLGETWLLPAKEAREASSVPDLLPEGGQVLVVAAGQGALALLRVQAEGGRPQTGEEFARGHRGFVGGRVGRLPEQGLP
jgi:methionyl-tRNA formyltransferase